MARTTCDSFLAVIRSIGTQRLT